MAEFFGLWRLEKVDKPIPFPKSSIMNKLSEFGEVDCMELKTSHCVRIAGTVKAVDGSI